MRGNGKTANNFTIISIYIKKMKETAEIYRKKTFFAIVDKNNKMVNGILKKKRIWEEVFLQMRDQTDK